MCKTMLGNFEKCVRCLLFFFLSLYVLNAIGNMDVFCSIYGERRYTNCLWILLFLYLVVSGWKINWRFLWEEGWFFVPLVLVYIFLYFYHSGRINLSYIKYGFLVLFSVAAIYNLKFLTLKTLFITNSISCVLIFLASIYEIVWLKYPIPNGDINQNIYALMVFMIGNVSIFSSLYKEFSRSYRIVFFFAGVLSVWVALRTSCRTAYFSELVLIGLYAYLTIKKFNWSMKKTVLFLLLCSFLLIAVILTSPSITADKFNLVSKEILGFFDLNAGETTNTSIGLRLAMWETALFEIFPKHPFFGIGDVLQLNWNDLHVVTKMDPKFAIGLTHFHNEAINIAVTGGGVLLLTCLWVLYKLFVCAKGNPVLLCLLVGSVAFGVTEVSFYHVPYFIVFLTIWFLYRAARVND